MQTNMRREINEIPEAAARLLTNAASAITATGKALRERDRVMAERISEVCHPSES